MRPRVKHYSHMPAGLSAVFAELADSERRAKVRSHVSKWRLDHPFENWLRKRAERVGDYLYARHGDPCLRQLAIWNTTIRLVDVAFKNNCRSAFSFESRAEDFGRPSFLQRRLLAPILENGNSLADIDFLMWCVTRQLQSDLVSTLSRSPLAGSAGALSLQPLVQFGLPRTLLKALPVPSRCAAALSENIDIDGRPVHLPDDESSVQHLLDGATSYWSEEWGGKFVPWRPDEPDVEVRPVSEAVVNARRGSIPVLRVRIPCFAGVENSPSLKGPTF